MYVCSFFNAQGVYIYSTKPKLDYSHLSKYLAYLPRKTQL